MPGRGTTKLLTDPNSRQQEPAYRTAGYIHSIHTHRPCQITRRTAEEMADAVRLYRDLNLRLHHACDRRIIHGCYADDNELVKLMAESEDAETAWQRADAALDALREAQCD
jgi:hypothetical protein